MSRRINSLLVVALAVVACNGVDRLLEGVPEPTSARLTMAVETQALTIIRGAEQTFNATVTRSKEYTGPVAMQVDQLPDGVVATVGPGSTAGASTTSPITIRATPTAQVGSFVILIRGRAEPLPDASMSVTLVIQEQPQYALTVLTDAVAVARGGIARVGARLTRINFASPVTLALQGVSGVTASFTVNPVTGDTTTATVSVAANAAPGNYTAQLRGTADGLADRTATLAVTVLADALQIIAPTTITMAQGSLATADLIVNRAGASGPVALAAEGLPTGATASFDLSGSTAAMRLVVEQVVAPGSYPVTIRATSAGVADATARATLVVNPSAIELVLAPANLSVFQGAAGTTVASLSRTSFTGAVSLAAEGVPDGITIVIQPPSITTGTSQITATASNTAPVGLFNIIIRATPTSGLGPSSAATLGVTVRSAPTGSGNVLLDWSGCQAPTWVAYLDGAGPWTRAEIVSGAVRFSVNTTRGAFAYVESDSAVTVRYMLRTELTAGPIKLCPPTPPAKTVYGSADLAAGDNTTWSLGGGTATATGATPNFSISGVASGTHDLIGWGTTVRLGVRGFIRRDQNIPSGGTLALADLGGTESFPPLRPLASITGGLVGEQFSHTMSYLTTAACTLNPLYAAVGQTTTMFGVPDAFQRVDDYHLITISASTPTAVRATSIAFHTMNGNRSYALPTNPVAPVVTTLAAPFKRLNAAFNSIPAQYNQTVSLAYRDGRHVMTAIGTVGYTGTTLVNLGIPDLSTVSGFPLTAAIPTNETGKWTASLDGVRTSGPLCAEGAGTHSWRLAGVF